LYDARSLFLIVLANCLWVQEFDLLMESSCEVFFKI